VASITNEGELRQNPRYDEADSISMHDSPYRRNRDIGLVSWHNCERSLKDDAKLTHPSRGPLRDALIHHMRDWLSRLKSTNWSLNWPHDFDTAVMRDPVTNTRKLTAQFIEHFLEYDNWSISGEALSAFPELIGRIRCHE
jgi:hypothetical protein